MTHHPDLDSSDESFDEPSLSDSDIPNETARPPTHKRVRVQNPAALETAQSRRSGPAARPRKKRGHQEANLASLGSSNFFEDEDAEEYEARNTLDPSLTHRKEILDQLFKNKTIKDVTKKDFKDAWAAFPYPRSAIKGDNSDVENGLWRLDGMRGRLHNHQLLGAAKMRRLEHRDEAPNGGIVADAMGLGSKTLYS